MLASALIYLPSLLVPRIAAFLALLIGAHLLPPAQFGYLSLVALIGEICEMTATNWLRIATVKFGATTGELGLRFAQRMAKAAVCTSAAAVVLAIAAAFVFAREDFTAVAAGVSAYVIANSVLRYGLTAHQILERRLQYAAIEIVRSIATLVAVAAAMVATREFLVPVLLGSGVTLVAGAYAVVAGLRRAKANVPDTTTVNELRLYAIPLILVTLLSYCVASIDKFLLKAFQDATALGLYAAGFAVARQGFDVVANAFNIGGFARLAALQDESQITKAQALLSRQMAYILAIALPAAGLLIASRDLIARILFPDAYLDSFITSVPLIAVGAIALNIKNFVYDNIFHLKSRNVRQIPTLAAGTVMSIVVGVLVVPRNPALGAALMFVSGAVVSLALSICLSSGLLRVPIAWSSLGTSTAIAVATWCSAWLVRSWPNMAFRDGGVLIVLAVLGTLSVICAVTLTTISEPAGRGVHGSHPPMPV